MHLYLPVVMEPKNEQPVSILTGKVPGGTETILVVEDEREVRKILVRIIRSLGYSVLEAGNGWQALELTWHYANPIHLLFAGVLMPEMDEPALARAGVHVVVSSG